MSTKNYAGNLEKRRRDREDRLARDIDYRSKTGRNLENTDTTYNNHTINEEGARVWSFK